MNIYELKTTSYEGGCTLYVSSDEDLTKEQLDEKFHAAMIKSLSFKDIQCIDLESLFYLMQTNPIVLEEQGLVVVKPIHTSSVFGWAGTQNAWESNCNRETLNLLAALIEKGYHVGPEDYSKD